MVWPAFKFLAQANTSAGVQEVLAASDICSSSHLVGLEKQYVLETNEEVGWEATWCTLLLPEWHISTHPSVESLTYSPFMFLWNFGVKKAPDGLWPQRKLPSWENFYHNFSCTDLIYLVPSRNTSCVHNCCGQIVLQMLPKRWGSSFWTFDLLLTTHHFCVCVWHLWGNSYFRY